ncbi:hypothetical protein [Acinetobacter sp. Ac_5812]|uniref:hypothetical protein n=1 Tax=Acinetobacter sp. Ac_5812 TaxID=1848937 RepID=UPI00148FD9E0|nr:hypothetical protein [Acinetobacter sp. Ac_5812]NNP70948.1 hypothetical protein [Acinetobacter sp. Ac_5812]
MRSDFEKWFKTSRSYLILKEANYYDLDLFEFNEIYKRYIHSGVQIAFETWQHRQTEVDELQKELQLSQTEIKSLVSRAGIDHKKIEFLSNSTNELQKRVDAFKEHTVMLREAAKSYVYTEREQNILLSQADDIEKILGIEQALKGGLNE